MIQLLAVLVIAALAVLGFLLASRSLRKERKQWRTMPEAYPRGRAFFYRGAHRPISEKDEDDELMRMGW